ITSRGGGTCTVRKTLPCGVSSMPLLPLRMRLSSALASGSRAMSAALTRRCAPVAMSVTTTAARRAARSVLRAARMSSFTLVHLLHVHPDLSAAGEPDLPGGLVGDAEFQRLRLAALDHVDRLRHHRTLDAAARHRAEEVALIVDHQVRAGRTGRRAPGLDHGRQRNTAALLAPVLGGFENIFVACEHLRVHYHSPDRHPPGLTRGPSCQKQTNPSPINGLPGQARQ